MAKNLKIAMTVTVMGLMLGVSPTPQICDAQDDPQQSSQPLTGVTVQISATLIHVEAAALEELQDPGAENALGTSTLSRLWAMAQSDEGVYVASRISLSVLHGHEGHMSYTETERQKNVNEDQKSGGYAVREVKVDFEATPLVNSEEKVLLRFDYKREQIEEVQVVSDESEEEEGMEHQLEVSNTLILRPGKSGIAGSKQEEDVTLVLVLQADI